jgi:hypothetical protein
MPGWLCSCCSSSEWAPPAPWALSKADPVTTGPRAGREPRVRLCRLSAVATVSRAMLARR